MEDHLPPYEERIHFVSYKVFYPFLIILGITSNAACIAVLKTPRMLSVPANKISQEVYSSFGEFRPYLNGGFAFEDNTSCDSFQADVLLDITRYIRYFLLLVTTDLIVCLLEIPIAVTSNGCILASFSAAVYHAYFGWTIIEFFETFRIYAMLFLSYDRFLAVWYPLYFKLQNKVKTFCLRVTLTVIFNVLFNLFFLFNVNCSDNRTAVSQCNLTSNVIQTAYHTNEDEHWHKPYICFHLILVRWIPEVLIGGFNISLIIAITNGRLRNPASSSQASRPKQFHLTASLIALTCSFFVCTLPISVWQVAFSRHINNKCYGDHELLKAIGNILQLTKNSLNIVFLAMLNPSFKRELKKLPHGLFLACIDEGRLARDLQMRDIQQKTEDEKSPATQADMSL